MTTIPNEFWRILIFDGLIVFFLVACVMSGVYYNKPIKAILGAIFWGIIIILGIAWVLKGG